MPSVSREWLNVDDSILNLLLAYGPIAFCISVLPSAALLNGHIDGLAKSVRLGAVLCVISAALRCVPCVQTERGIISNLCVHCAQFINAAVAPLIVASPAYLSRMWFPPEQVYFV